MELLSTFWCFVYNTTLHTRTKYTLFALVFEKVCYIPSNLSDNLDPLYNYDHYMLELRYRLKVVQRDAREHLLRSKLVTKKLYDRNMHLIVYKILFTTRSI